MNDENWAVYRQDFTGNEFLVEKGLKELEAKELVEVYESHKHHQHYWACREPRQKTDYSLQMIDLLGTGSSLKSALTVLRNQNASDQECIGAIVKTKNIEQEEAEKLFQVFIHNIE